MARSWLAMSAQVFAVQLKHLARSSCYGTDTHLAGALPLSRLCTSCLPATGEIGFRRTEDTQNQTLIGKSMNYSNVLEELRGAISQLRAIARIEHDSQREHAAQWLDRLFDVVADRRSLRSACAKANGH